MGGKGAEGYSKLNLQSICTYEGILQFLEKSHVIASLTCISKCAYLQHQIKVFKMHLKIISRLISYHHLSLYQHLEEHLVINNQGKNTGQNRNSL